MSQTREQELENTVVEYRNQLSTVIAAINADFDGTNSEELRALKTSLEEVIAFTEVELIAVKKQALLDRLSSCGADGDNDDIHCVFDGHNGNAFVDHRYGDAMPSTSSSSRSFTDRIGDNIYQKQEEVDGDSDHKELMDSIRAMNGSKCLAPYVEQNGTVGHHNAIIMITDEELSATNSDCDIRVKVLFTNPICRSMKPCAHYMSGKCRYSDDKCHYSHGHRVSFHSIKPYEEVDHSLITKDSVCLAKCATDELWYKAVIDEYQEDTHKFVVKYLKGGIIDTVDIEHLLPLNANTSDTSDDSSTSDDDSGEESQEEVTPHVPKLALRHGSASALGEWEMHTKGIGSKLMRKMGYVFGEGLGKNSEGRTEPIEVTIFPAGKSLDMCMRIRERKAGKDPIKHMRRQWAKKAAINAKFASGYNRANNKPNGSVFDFINNKVAKSGAKCDNSDKDDASNRHALPLSKLKSTDNQSLNVLSLKIAEHTRKAELELSRLQCSIETRKSKSRERQTVTHLESQVVKQRNLIKSLRDQEFAIQRELKLRSNNKKLEIF